MRSSSLLALALVGCAASPRHAAAPPSVAVEKVEMEPLEIRVVGAGAARHVEAYDAAGLFDQAGQDLAAERWDDAAAGYDRVVQEFPESRYVGPALYNAGLALEGKKDYAGAVARYRALVERRVPGGAGARTPSETHDVLDALFRMGSCLAELGNWAASAEAFAELGAYRELRPTERIEAIARRGLAQYRMKDRATAERSFHEALALFHEISEVERVEDDFFVAMSQFYLAELSHDDFRALPIRLPERQMRQDLDEKARMLLVAQGRYVDVARIRNPAWATAAGFQMASLYREFYDAVMGAPLPRPLSTEERQVYFEELRREIEPLLRKAIHAHELTQQVAEHNGVDNEWVRKSNEQLEQLRALLVPAPPPPAAAPPARSIPVRPELEKMQPPSLPPRDERPRIIL